MGKLRVTPTGFDEEVLNKVNESTVNETAYQWLFIDKDCQIHWFSAFIYSFVKIVFSINYSL